MKLKLIYKITFLLFFLGLLLQSGIAQETDYITVVKLNDGSVLEGQLTEYHDGEYIKMNIGDNDITIKFESIKNIRHKNVNGIQQYTFKEEGLYHNSSLSFLPGFISAGNSVLGIQIDHTSGYLFNRWLGAGVNIGISNYVPGTREIFYTAAAELRGYLMERNISPFYALRAGYGFAFKGQSFEEANGGYFLNPAIGFRFGGKKHANITAELGLNFQKGHFVQESSWWWDRSTIEKNVRYQRLNFKIGLLF